MLTSLDAFQSLLLPQGLDHRVCQDLANHQALLLSHTVIVVLQLFKDDCRAQCSHMKGLSPSSVLHKSVELDGMYLRELREPDYVFERLFSVMFGRLW